MKKILRYGYRTLGMLMLAFLVAKPVSAQKSLSVQHVLDSRKFHGITVGWLNKELPYNLELSGFTDINSESGSKDLNNFYIEPRITRTRLFGEGEGLVRKVLNNFGVMGEYNGSSGENNDKIRAGMAFNNKIKGVVVNFKYLPFNTESGQQLSVFLSKNAKDWYITGFVDYNIINGENKVLSEVWGGHRIRGNLYAGVELRLNEFLKGKNKGICTSIEYKF